MWLTPLQTVGECLLTEAALIDGTSLKGKNPGLKSGIYLRQGRMASIGVALCCIARRMNKAVDMIHLSLKTVLESEL